MTSGIVNYRPGNNISSESAKSPVTLTEEEGDTKS